MTAVTVGPVEPGHELLPLQPALDVLLRVVAAVDEVLRPDEADPAVDDDELAVVAQVGPLVLALERLHRQHPAPLHADAVELGEGLLACRETRSDAMWSASSRTDDAALHRPLHRARRTPCVVSSNATMKNSTCTNRVAVSMSAAIASIEPR